MDLGSLYPQVESFVQYTLSPSADSVSPHRVTNLARLPFLGSIISSPLSIITLPKWGNVLTLSWELYSSSSRTLYASSGASLLFLHLGLTVDSLSTYHSILHLQISVDSQNNGALGLIT